MTVSIGNPERQDLETKVVEVKSPDEILPQIPLRTLVEVNYWTGKKSESSIMPRVGFFGGYDRYYVYLCDHKSGLQMPIPKMSFLNRADFQIEKVPKERVANITLLKPEIGYKIVVD